MVTASMRKPEAAEPQLALLVSREPSEVQASESKRGMRFSETSGRFLDSMKSMRRSREVGALARVCACVCVCICLCVCACVCACVGMVWGPGVDVDVAWGPRGVGVLARGCAHECSVGRSWW